MPRITTPPMPTCVGAPCPAVTFDANRALLRGVGDACLIVLNHGAFVGDGLCVAIHNHMYGKFTENDIINTVHEAIGGSLAGWIYLPSYLRHHEDFDGFLDSETKNSIRREWAGHIAHFLFDALGDDHV